MIRDEKFCRVASIITGMIHNGDTQRDTNLVPQEGFIKRN
jgi:hypothetical protein